MTLDTKRWIIAGLSATFLLSLVFVQWMEVARRAAESGDAAPHITVPASSTQCVDCHDQSTPGGQNVFSHDPDDVWVDEKGRLHLTIQHHDDRWWSTEVILLESLGHGTYWFVTESEVEDLDANATLGAFTWDTYGGGRYLDVELGDDDQAVLDFNRASNPYCTYNAYDFNCAIPPASNRLTFRMPAGEKKPLLLDG